MKDKERLLKEKLNIFLNLCNVDLLKQKTEALLIQYMAAIDNGKHARPSMIPPGPKMAEVLVRDDWYKTDVSIRDALVKPYLVIRITIFYDPDDLNVHFHFLASFSFEGVLQHEELLEV